MRTGNPTLNDATFDGLTVRDGNSQQMTLGGTVNKTALLLALSLITAVWCWGKVMAGIDPQTGQLASGIMPLIWGSAIGGFVIAMIATFAKKSAPITAPLYALVEGVFLGGISAFFELSFPGIVTQAVMLTFGTLGALLLAYKSGLIRATENFKLGVVAATGAVALLYLVSFGLSFFDIRIPFIHEGGLLGIGFSLVVVVIAALNLVLDFDFIEQGVEQGAPKYMEWYAAFGLMVTLVWLYLEILRLLAKLRSE